MYEKCNFEKSMGVSSPLALHPFTAGEHKNEQSKGCINKNFAETFAETINYIWQDLTEEEKQQIREVLE